MGSVPDKALDCGPSPEACSVLGKLSQSFPPLAPGIFTSRVLGSARKLTFLFIPLPWHDKPCSHPTAPLGSQPAETGMLGPAWTAGKPAGGSCQGAEDGEEMNSKGPVLHCLMQPFTPVQSAGGLFHACFALVSVAVQCRIEPQGVGG